MGSQMVMGLHPFPMGFSSGRLYAMVTVLLARARLWPAPGVPVKLGTDMKL